MRFVETGSASRPSVLADWWARLEARRVVAGPEAALASELDGWLELIPDALGPEPSARHELHKRVAFHARALGLEARPASAAVHRLLALEAAVRARLRPPPELEALLDGLVELAADAHALGAAERLEAAARRRRSDAAPVLELGRRVIGFVPGLDADTLDAVCGRALRLAFGAEAELLCLELGAALEAELEPRALERLCRTLDGLLRSDAARGLRLELSGVRDRAGLRAGLARAGVPLARVDLYDDLRDLPPVPNPDPEAAAHGASDGRAPAMDQESKR
jgi:hypothetical protein